MFNHMKEKAGAKKYRNKIIACTGIDDDLTPYYLRHTFCTNALAAGVPLQVIQYFMGHSVNNSVTDIYTHITDKMIETARAQINNYWNDSINKRDNETIENTNS